jgi:hypothetical protein
MSAALLLSHLSAAFVGVTDNFINNFKLIGPGPGNNLLIHEDIHVTINANGTLTATHDHFTAECK